VVRFDLRMATRTDISARTPSARTVRRAARAGVLRRSGRVRGRQVSAVETAYIESHWPQIGEMREVLRTERGVGAIVMFGSFARGEDRQGSDIDLVLLSRGSPVDRPRLKRRLEAAAGRRIDLVDWETMVQAPSVALAVIRDGRVVVDRLGAFADLRSRREAVRRRAARLEQRQWRDIERLWSA
jgi:predicted nucleotidyltransferase